VSQTPKTNIAGGIRDTVAKAASGLFGKVTSWTNFCGRSDARWRSHVAILARF